MKQTHCIHVCLIIFLIHYFDMTNLLKSDKINFDSIMNLTHYKSISVTWAIKVNESLYKQCGETPHF